MKMADAAIIAILVGIVLAASIGGGIIGYAIARRKAGKAPGQRWD